MSVWRLITQGLRGLVRPGRVDREIDEELADFVSRAAADAERRGLSSVDAERAARVEVGSLAAAREEVRTGFWEFSVLTCLRDVRFGARMLRRTPAFSATAICTLALGLGATTALYTVARAVLLDPVPVRQPEQLVFLRWTATPRNTPPISVAGANVDAVTGATTSSAFSKLTFDAWSRAEPPVRDVIAFAAAIAEPSAPGLNDGPQGQVVSGNYFPALGLQPRLGRLLTPDDDRPGAPPAVVISHRYWQRVLGGDDGAIGRSLRFFTAGAEIVGVTPAGFSGLGQLGDAPDFFMTIAAGRAAGARNKFVARMDETWVWPFRIFARIDPGATASEVQRALQPAFAATAAEAWLGNPRAQRLPPELPTLHVESGALGLTDSRDTLRGMLAILAWIAGAILVIVCLNLTNLLLARGETRHAEMAVRLAIGARRGRLVRQLVTESVLLSAIGAALGVLVAGQGKDVALAWMARVNPNFVVEPSLDVSAFLFAAGLALVVGIIVGLVPALRATRASIHVTVRDSKPAGAALVRRTLIVSQVALCLVFIVAATLLVRSVGKLHGADIGFNPENLVVFRVAAAASSFEPRSGSVSVFDDVAAALRPLPALTSVAYAEHALLGGDLAMPYLTIPGVPKTPDEDRTVYTQAVSKDFFQTLEMPLAEGRQFVDSDRDRRVGIVNQTLARRFFGSDSAIGRFVAITKNPDAPSPPAGELLEIVGVVRDAKYQTLRDVALPTVFLPFSHMAGGATFMVRTRTPAALGAGEVRTALASAMPGFSAGDFRTQKAQIGVTFAREEHFAAVATAFAGLAIVLTAVGLYGLVSYTVARKTPEIGLRIALGASRRHVLRDVLRETITLASLGIALGLFAATSLSSVVGSLLFGLSAGDTWTRVLAIAMLAAVCMLAAALPARRAAFVDPIVALRAE